VSRRRAPAPGLLLLALWGCDQRAAKVAFDPGPIPVEHAEGARRFAASCTRCHGPHATGTDIGPPLVHIYYEPNHHADIAFQRAVRFGVPQHHWSYGSMPPVAAVDEAATEQITAYVRWLQRTAGIY
jgi:hypothetical protein